MIDYTPQFSNISKPNTMGKKPGWVELIDNNNNAINLFASVSSFNSEDNFYTSDSMSVLVSVFDIGKHIGKNQNRIHIEKTLINFCCV